MYKQRFGWIIRAAVFLSHFRANLQIPLKAALSDSPISSRVVTCVFLHRSTPCLHFPYLCIFYNSPIGRQPEGKQCRESRVSLERGYHGYGMVRITVCAASHKISYIVPTRRSLQRGCGLFMFDTFPAFSVLLYRKAHNPTKERTRQKGPALFLRQGKLPRSAACPSFSEIRK